MPTFILKQKYIFILICLIMVILSTGLFLIGENKLDHHDLKATVLTEDQISTVQNEDFYRNLIHNHDDALFILKTDSLIHFSTESWRNEFGYTMSDVNNKNFFTFIHPKDLPFFVNSLLVLMQEGESNENIGPFRIKDKSGQYHLYIATVIPLFFDKEEKIGGIALTLKDISIQ